MHSTKDAAAMLGISRQRVLALIQSGTLNAIVTDKGYIVDGDSIKARLEANGGIGRKHRAIVGLLPFPLPGS